jgi:thioredoxin-like negative regulator of GroEL
MLHPILESLQSKNPEVRIVKINVDEDREKAAEFGIRSLPTLLFMKDDAVLENVKGLKPENFYQDLIQKHLA